MDLQQSGSGKCSQYKLLNSLCNSSGLYNHSIASAKPMKEKKIETSIGLLNYGHTISVINRFKITGRKEAQGTIFNLFKQK